MWRWFVISLAVLAMASPVAARPIEGLFGSGAGEVAAAGAQVRSAQVTTHAARGEVKPVLGASARLVVSSTGASLYLFAVDLVPGHVYTAWWVVINKPGACASIPCGGPDVLQRTNVVDADVGYATGAIADRNGSAFFEARLATGNLPGGWFRKGLKDPYRAEIHVVLHDHGPVIESMRENMLRSLRGGCTDASVPAAYPAVAKADGTPGPNRCQLYQFAIFAPPAQGLRETRALLPREPRGLLP